MGTRFGISDISFYLPAPTINLDELARHRATQGADGDKLLKSLEFTGQRQARIPDWYEDTVTMVAEATQTLLERNPQVSPAGIRHFAGGTETPQDYSKPVSTYCQGLVQVRGETIGPNARTYEVKHACAGGTYAMLSVLSAMASEAQFGPAAAGLTVMGDVARYRAGSAAELTQGAGAVGLLLEQNPRLLEVESGLVGVWGESVDDFFRSIGNVNASVKGRFSLDCYIRALTGAYDDFKHRALESGFLPRPAGGHFLDNFDYMLFHAPFQTMPLQAVREILMRRRDITPELADREAARLRVEESTRTISRTGNLYTGSLYLCLGSLLEQEYARIGEKIEGARLLLTSYGSGNTMVVFTARVVPGAGEVIKRLGLARAMERTRLVSGEEYDRLLDPSLSGPEAFARCSEENSAEIEPGAYRLQTIRPDGYRVYTRA